jgi:hypothetical protein
LLHAIAITLEERVGRTDVAVELDHASAAVGSRRIARRRYHPQQSVLNPHDGHRQTACMRYMAAPQRSQTVGGSPAAAVAVADVRSGVIARPDEGTCSLQVARSSAMRQIMAWPGGARSMERAAMFGPNHERTVD